MNEPENVLQNASRPADGSDKSENLRRQINLLFGGLIVTSFTLTAYLGLQARRASMDLNAVRPRTEEAIKAVQLDDARVQEVFAKLTDFGRTHPDFQNRILSRYKLAGAAPATTPKK